MDFDRLNKIAFDNLNELLDLSNDKYIVISDLIKIEVKNKSDEYDDIDNIYKEKDIEYSIYFTFYQLLLHLKRVNYIYIHDGYTRGKILDKMNKVTDNLFYVFNNNDNDDDNKLSHILNSIDDLLIDEIEDYKNNKCYYTIIENFKEINFTFRKIMGHNYNNHTGVIKYYLPDLEPLLFYNKDDDNESDDNESDDNEILNSSKSEEELSSDDKISTSSNSEEELE